MEQLLFGVDGTFWVWPGGKDTKDDQIIATEEYLLLRLTWRFHIGWHFVVLITVSSLGVIRRVFLLYGSPSQQIHSHPRLSSGVRG